jgi:hypothetical protein
MRVDDASSMRLPVRKPLTFPSPLGKVNGIRSRQNLAARPRPTARRRHRSLSMNQDQADWNANPAGGGSDAPPLPPPPRDPDRGAPSWENRHSIGFLRAWFGTIGEVLIHPDRTFQNMNPEGGIGAPFGFYALTVWLTNAIGFFLSIPTFILFRGQQAALLERLSPALAEWVERGFSLPGQAFAAFVTRPIIWLVGLFVASAIIHLLLMLCGGAQRTFETTLRAIAYAAAACSVLDMLPLCGCNVFIMGVAMVVVIPIALTRAHGTDTWRAVLAVTLPAFLFFLCCCGVISLMTAGMANSPELQQLFQNLR